MSKPSKISSPSSVSVSSPQEHKQEDVLTSDFIKRLYSVDLMSNDDLLTFYDVVRYHGFDRSEVLKQLSEKIPDPRKAAWAVILVALRGPRAASETKMPDGTTLVQMGIAASGAQGYRALTCNKIQAATADLAAFYLKRLNVPKRVQSPLPGWLQFPSAGSIKLPENLRQEHIDFHKAFSRLIKGEFNEAIYSQMVSNAYLEPSLRLFE